MNVIERFNAWIPQVQGKYINMDGAYGAQCWDLAAHWSAFLGLPIINTGYKGRWVGWAGNMVDAFPQTPEIAAAYSLHGPHEKGQTGDIVVWDDSYWYYPATHVAVLYADKNNQLVCMSQNSTPSRADNPYPAWSSGPTTIQSLPRQGLIGFIRPHIGGLAPQSSTTPITSEEDDMSEAQYTELSRKLDSVLDALISGGKDEPVSVLKYLKKLDAKLADIDWSADSKTSLRQEIANIKVSISAVLQKLEQEEGK